MPEPQKDAYAHAHTWDNYGSWNVNTCNGKLWHPTKQLYFIISQQDLDLAWHRYEASFVQTLHLVSCMFEIEVISCKNHGLCYQLSDILYPQLGRHTV